jgi:hypothetical protein
LARDQAASQEILDDLFSRNGLSASDDPDAYLRKQSLGARPHSAGDYDFRALFPQPARQQAGRVLGRCKQGFLGCNIRQYVNKDELLTVPKVLAQHPVRKRNSDSHSIFSFVSFSLVVLC